MYSESEFALIPDYCPQKLLRDVLHMLCNISLIRTLMYLLPVLSHFKALKSIAR